MSLPAVRNTLTSRYSFQQSLDQYIYFSPLTTGTGASGRSVKIHKDLFLPFFCSVDPNSHTGQTIIREIENLRTTRTITRAETGSDYANNPKQSSAHQSRIGSLNNSFQQTLITKNLHVHYRVSQESGDKAPSIYITKIRAVNPDAGAAAGLYEAKSSFRGQSAVTRTKNLSVDGKKVYINGSSMDLNGAMKHAQYAANNSDAVLFYSPVSVSNDLGVWKSNSQTYTTKSATNELVNIFKQNQNPKSGTSWYVEGEGAALLAEALKQIPNELAKHEFQFINPIGNTAKLFEALTHKKATLAGEFLTYSRNITSLLSISEQKEQLLTAMGKLPAAKNYDIITRRYIVEAITALTSASSAPLKQNQKLNATATTFVQALKKAGMYR